MQTLADLAWFRYLLHYPQGERKYWVCQAIARACQDVFQMPDLSVIALHVDGSTSIELMLVWTGYHSKTNLCATDPADGLGPRLALWLPEFHRNHDTTALLPLIELALLELDL